MGSCMDQERPWEERERKEKMLKKKKPKRPWRWTIRRFGSCSEYGPVEHKVARYLETLPPDSKFKTNWVNGGGGLECVVELIEDWDQ